MDLDTARKIVERISETPASSVSIEFQGGEPLTNLPVIKEVVAYAKECLKNKIVEYSLVSNLSLVNDEIADFIADNGINVSTSLDGPQPLMNSSFYPTFRGRNQRFIMECTLLWTIAGYRPQ